MISEEREHKEIHHDNRCVTTGGNLMVSTGSQQRLIANNENKSQMNIAIFYLMILD